MKKMFIILMLVMLAGLMSGCSSEQPGKEEHAATRIMEDVIHEDIIQEDIIQEDIIQEIVIHEIVIH